VTRNLSGWSYEELHSMIAQLIPATLHGRRMRQALLIKKKDNNSNSKTSKLTAYHKATNHTTTIPKTSSQ